jgi:hypothetical protein
MRPEVVVEASPERAKSGKQSCSFSGIFQLS